MFLRYNKNTVLETYISKSFLLFKDVIIDRHKKQYKEEDIKGSSCVQYSIMDIYLSILFVVLIYNDVISTNNTSWEYYNNKYCIDRIRKCLACKGIDIDLILNVFGLPYEGTIEGINFDIIGSTFEIEPATLIPLTTTVVDINTLLNTNDNCINYFKC